MSITSDGCSLVVVTPVFNEADIIESFLNRLARVADTVPIRGLVVVDDGSTDPTVARIRQAAPHLPFPVRIVRLSRNFGHQNAIIAGLAAGSQWAGPLHASWIGVIDADLQDRPEHFADLLSVSEH